MHNDLNGEQPQDNKPGLPFAPPPGRLNREPLRLKFPVWYKEVEKRQKNTVRIGFRYTMLYVKR